MTNIDLSKLSTEKINQATIEIGSSSSLNIVRLINKEDASVHVAVSKKEKEIADAIDVCCKAIKNGGRVIYIGAGTSGRLGVLDASEVLPTFGVKDKFVGLIAGGDVALRLPVENAEDNEQQAIKDLQNVNLSSNDVLIGLTASGRTPYVVSALKYAKSLNCKTISISTSFLSEVSTIADISIEVLVGPEPITGSTRMKSGTAQKMVLNMISSGTMIKMGKVYRNLMIDVQPSNLKLIQRSKNIIREITKASDDLIDDVFNKSNQSVPLSIIMILKKCNFEKAKEIYNSQDFSWNDIDN